MIEKDERCLWSTRGGIIGTDCGQTDVVEARTRKTDNGSVMVCHRCNREVVFARVGVDVRLRPGEDNKAGVL